MIEINKDTKEKVIPERDKMGLVQALIILHGVRSIIKDDGEIAQALDTVFIQIDEMNLMLDRIRNIYIETFGCPPSGM